MMSIKYELDYEYGRAMESKRPRGGWVFEEDGEILRGNNHEDLVRKLRKYRGNRGIMFSDCDGDVRRSICKSNPHLCKVVQKKKIVETETPKEKSLSKIAFEWLSGITRNPYSRVIPEVKKERADICRACPHNLKNIKPEDEVGASHEYRLNNSTRGKFDSDLGCCEIHKHDNRVAVWLKGLKPNPLQPKQCWIEEDGKDN